MPINRNQSKETYKNAQKKTDSDRDVATHHLDKVQNPRILNKPKLTTKRAKNHQDQVSQNLSADMLILSLSITVFRA